MKKLLLFVLVSISSFLVGILFTFKYIEEPKIESIVDCENPSLSEYSTLAHEGKQEKSMPSKNIVIKERKSPLVGSENTANNADYNKLVAHAIMDGFNDNLMAKHKEDDGYDYMSEVEDRFYQEASYPADREKKEKDIYDAFYNSATLYKYPVGDVECRLSQCRVLISIEEGDAIDEISVELARIYNSRGDVVIVDQKRNYELSEMYLYLSLVEDSREALKAYF